MGGIAYGTSNSVYKRVGWSNSSFRFCAFGTDPYVYTLSSYTSTWYNISSSRYATRSSYVSSLAFTATKSYAYASNANSTSSYSNSYVKTFRYYSSTSSSYKTSNIYTGTYSLTYPGWSTSGTTSSSKTFYSTSVQGGAGGQSMTTNISKQTKSRTFTSSKSQSGTTNAQNNTSSDAYSTAFTKVCGNSSSSWNVSSSIYKSSKYLSSSTTTTSAASRANDATYSYSNSYATKTY